MDDLISRQAAIEICNDELLHTEDYSPIRTWNRILQLPSALPEIIKCKDCEHGDWYKNAKEEWRCYCLKTEARNMGEDDFCSYAERRTDEIN